MSTPLSLSPSTNEEIARLQTQMDVVTIGANTGADSLQPGHLPTDGSSTQSGQDYVNCLPPELLLGIFRLYVSWCRDRWERSREDPKHKLRLYLWMRVMLVCKRWRNLAMFSPDFWSYIAPGRNLECIKMMIERSQGLPLVFRLADSRIPGDIRSKIFNEIHRVHLLKVSFDEEEELEAFDSVPMNAPIMKHLALRARFQDTGYAPLELPQMPENYGQGILQCRSLRSLSLTYIGNSGPPSYFLDLLESLPQIEKFELSSFPEPATEEPRYQERSCVTLSQLRTLVITGPIEECTWLISHLDFLPSTRLLCNVGEETDGVSNGDLLSMLSEKVQLRRNVSPASPALAPVESARFSLGRCALVWLCRRDLPTGLMKPHATSLESCNDEERPEEFVPDLGFYVDYRDFEQTAWLIDRHFTLTTVKSLLIDGTSYQNGRFEMTAGRTLAKIFGQCGSLRTLYVGWSLVGDVASFLLHCDNHGVEDCKYPNCRFIFPDLQYLYVENLDWSASRKPLREDRPLYEMLRQRQLRNMPLKKLKVFSFLDSKYEPVDVQFSLDLINGPGTQVSVVDENMKDAAYHRFPY